MTCHLLIQPFDSDFDFLEDIGNQAKFVYRPKIKSFEILPKARLSDYAITQKSDWISKFFIENIAMKVPNPDIDEVKRHYEAGEKLVYVNDIFEEMKMYWNYNSKGIFLGVVPYFIYGLMDTPNGQASASLNMAVMSNFGLKAHPHEVSVGIGIHEIGHDLDLEHCKKANCLMKFPGKFEDFYDGVYELCEKHKRKIVK
jgi:predicted Zn-dependent protease